MPMISLAMVGTHVCLWLPLIYLVGDNREFEEFEAYF